MKTKIYTKKGDSGETSLFGGPRVSKAHPQIEAYGHVDELNAAVGLCLSYLRLELKNKSELTRVIQLLEQSQNELFAVGSHLACADEKLRPQLPALKTNDLFQFESEMDHMTDKLPELKEFILPGGHPLACHLHMARTICRRAERAVEKFRNTGSISHDLVQPLIQYLNRFADYLFLAARYVNFQLHSPEVKWKK